MKKLILLFFLLILLSSKQEITEPVSITDSNDIVCITVENLNHKNMIKKLQGIELFYIQPYVSPIYQNKLMNLKKYPFYESITTLNVSVFAQYYLDTLKQNGYIQDYYQYYVHGIPIEKVFLEKNEFLMKIYHKIKYTIC